MSKQPKDKKDLLAYITTAVFGICGAVLAAFGAWEAHHGRTIAGLVLALASIGTALILALRPKGK